MPLTPGTRLGPYEIVAAAGAGGMGEVYRARDTRLDRTVAIKVLSAPLAADQELRQRFEREARAISALSHPHICTLFDIGEAPGPAPTAEAVQFLVLEYLEGQTLAQKLVAGPLAVETALTYAMQIADALDKAHRAGIVHRDLKPANVMITKAGAKLLDFGLAKTAAPVVAASGLSMLPTTPPGLTAQGTILGTFQYMAPEQIEGLEADARTDVFACGALLFEMVTGRPAFDGKTRAALLGAILKDDPARVTTLVPGAPRALDRVIATCLAKDPDDRYQTARDLLRELKWAASPEASSAATASVASAPKSSRLAWSVAALALAGFAIAAVVAVRQFSETPARGDVVRFTIPQPEDRQFGGPRGPGTGQATQIAVSPDSRHVAFVAGTGDRAFQLWLRRFDSPTSVPVPGTDDATFPFWSPDSTAVGFFAEGKLKRVEVGGGPAVTLCDAPSGRGGTWAPDGTIVFAPGVGGPLHRVSSAGGISTPVSTLDASYGEVGHRFPRFLPDGRTLLFTAVTGAATVAPKPSIIKLMTVGSGTAATLVTAESHAEYLAGHLLFQRDGILMAQPLDARTGRLQGEPFPIAEDIGTEGSRYSSFSAASSAGTLVYASGGRIGTRLMWTDRSGKVVETVGEQALYTGLALSPDGRRAAVALTTGPPVNRDIWVVDLARGVMTRLTFQPGEDTSPVWSPDGTRLAFQSMRAGSGSLRTVRVGGTGVDEALIEQESGVFVPSDWSADGRHILYSHSEVSLGNSDVWALPVEGDRKPISLTQTPFNELYPVLSPDGRWFAYASNESGEYQVYVQPFPPTGRKYLVSRDAGSHPLWRSDGRELYFLAQNAALYAVDVVTAPDFEAGTPQRLFASLAPAFAGSRAYGVSGDGQRFLFAAASQVANAPLQVVLNWSPPTAR